MPTLSKQLVQEIEGFRKEKDSYFASDSESPIPGEDRPGFKGLRYFPSPDYRVKARLNRFDKAEVISMTTSKGTIRPYVKYGAFRFELEGKRLQLHAYKAADDPQQNSLFVPFTDETSGRESYGTGRYLDIEEARGRGYVLDFNLAYNPYCAYNENYVCPFPGRENRLPLAVKAGEKSYR